jgi:kynurenine formamidase
MSETATTTDKVSRAEFDEIVERIRVWGKPGADGQPLFKRITPGVTRAALQNIRSGEAISLGRPWAVEAAVDNRHPAIHYMSAVGDVLAHGDVEPTGYKDFIGVDYHGKTMSHIDAFSHIAYKDQIFGGISASESLTSTGMANGDVTLFGSLITRGVLIDMARYAQVPWTEPGTAWSLEQIQEALEQQAVVLQKGDAVLFRSGHDRRRAELGPWDPDASGAGVHVRAMEWLFEQGVAILGADGETDVRPSPVEGVTLPIHVLALTMAGVPLLDNLDLDALGDACQDKGQYDFALVVTPLNIPKGTGSPVNPAAIF